MVSSLINIFLVSVFIFAFLSQMFRLPPLIGFLFSGFFIRYLLVSCLGYSLNDTSNSSICLINSTLSKFSEIGIYILLFSIGLKLKVKELFKKENLIISILQSILFTIFSGFFLYYIFLIFITSENLALNLQKTLVLCFALSFSSTVLVMNILNQRGEVNGLPGRMSTSILVLQDVLAVAYLVLSQCINEGIWPSRWSFLVPIAYFLLRPISNCLLSFLGRGELLTLGGLFFAIIGSAIFDCLGLHGDLGALVAGLIFVGHEKSQELYTRLEPIKDMLLIFYFLQLGLKGLPEVEGVIISLIILSTFLFKFILIFCLMKMFRFRSRTSLLVTFYLSNFSEFGLIVTSYAVKNQTLSSEWLTIIALATVFSFLISKPLELCLPFFNKIINKLFPFTTNEYINKGDRLISLEKSKVLILGMGRVGTGAYDELVARYGENLAIGIEISEEKKNQQVENGRRVVFGDATDPELWNKIVFGKDLELILITMSTYQVSMSALSSLKKYSNFNGRIAAIVIHEDERLAIRNEGVDAVFNVYNEAGTGFAMHLIDVLNLDEIWPNPKQLLVIDNDENSNDINSNGN